MEQNKQPYEPICCEIIDLTAQEDFFANTGGSQLDAVGGDDSAED